MNLSPYVAFVLAFSVFAAVHSIMASNWFKEKVGSGTYRHYRILYNVVSIITFLPVFFVLVTYSAYAPVIYTAPQFLHLPLYVVQAVSLGAAIITFLGVNPSEFMGFKSGVVEKGQLVTAGLYGLVRHPLYLCVIVFLWAKPVFDLLYFLAAFLFTAYFIVGSFLEERRLVREFGYKYRRYQKEVSMFLPLNVFK